MSWDFDELDSLEASRASQAFVPSGVEHSRSVLGGGQELEIERSRRRIEASMHEGWQKILDLNLHKTDSASVRKAYHSLALLHHPDKSGSHADVETFKIVHKAYTDAVAAVSLQESTSLRAGARSAGCRPSDHGKKWPLGSSSSKDRSSFLNTVPCRDLWALRSCCCQDARSWFVQQWTNGSTTMMRAMSTPYPTAFLRLKPWSLPAGSKPENVWW